MKKQFVAAASAAVLAAGVLAGCGSNSASTAGTSAAASAQTEAAQDASTQTAAAASTAADTQASAAAPADGDNKITVACSQTPHSEILEQAKAVLEAQGYDLEYTVFEDYVQPNKKGTHLVVATNGKIHYEPFGIYGGTKKSLDEIADGDAIAIPNDTTNEARALLLLQQAGLITLNDGVGVTATVNDVKDNPHNLKLVEVEAAQVPKQLPSVAFGVINGNYALENGLSVKKDALVTEAADGDAIQQYVNIIAVKEGNEDLPKIKALTDALHSDTIVKYINDTYDGAVVPYDGAQ